MATIVKFSVPSLVLAKLNAYDVTKIVNNVQSDLNAGTVRKSSTKQSQDWKSVKNDDGEERMVIDVRTKTGESLRLENTIATRFFAWCNSLKNLQTYGETDFVLPDCFVKWFDKTAKLS